MDKDVLRDVYLSNEDKIKVQNDGVREAKAKQKPYLDKIKGSMIGGAAGDALGYTVEFLRDYQIFDKYGKQGITEYDLTNGIAQISDDTQMTLFTANAILFGETRLAMRGIGGDPMMYAPCAYLDWNLTQLTHILNRIVYPTDEKLSTEEIIMEARDAVKELFCGDRHIDELVSIINKAIELSKNDEEDLKNIKRLGESWVAEETLAIAIYCSLKYQNDFSKGIVAAVNHSGDSDSTGAVTGNILGALIGYENIDKKWKNNLELHDVIAEMSEDLCYGCHMDEYSDYYDEEWVRKYMDIHWKNDINDEPQNPLDIINSTGGLARMNRILRSGGKL